MELVNWPSRNMDFYGSNNKEEMVTIEWSDDHFENYKFMACSFSKCGYRLFYDIIDDRNNSRKTDMWFLTAIFLVRQGIELGLKALVCKSHVTKEIQGVLMEYKHNVLGLYSKVKEDICLKHEEKTWLEKYLASIKLIDKDTDVFRFSFEDQFISEYGEKSLNIEAVVNNLLQAFSLIEKCMHDGENVYEYEFNNRFKPEFLIFAENGLENCYIWQPYFNDGHYIKINGYRETIEFLYNDKTLSGEEKIFPLMFMGRNTIEVCLKKLLLSKINGNIPIRQKSHLLKRDLWGNGEKKGTVKLLILKYLNTEEEEHEDVEAVGGLIDQLNALDKGGDKFRYPTSYSLEYYFNNKKFDLENVYTCFLSLINYFEACDTRFEAIADQQAKLQL